MARALALATVSSTCSVGSVVLEKLTVSPVALAKLFKITLRAAAATGDATTTMSVSSAYCRTMGEMRENGVVEGSVRVIEDELMEQVLRR